MKDYKKIEQSIYDDHYSKQSRFDDASVREDYLDESETYFKSRLEHLSCTDRVLEIGCGTGNEIIFAARKAKFALGTDISFEGLRRARESAKLEGLQDTIAFVQMDAEQLAIRKDTFDLIIDHEAFSSVDCKVCLPELRRVLRHGGTLLGIEAYGHNFIFNFNRWIGSLRGRRSRWAIRHILTYKDLLLAQSLFREMRVSYFHFVIVICAAITKLLPFNCAAQGTFAKQIDRKLLLRPLFRKLAFKVVFELKA